jgi:dihydrofolate reductase
MKKFSMILAVADNGVIGKDNKIPWNLPEELKRFKEITTGNVVVMGSKTFKSIGRALPNRQNIVLTREVLDENGVTIPEKVINNNYKNTFFVGNIEDIYTHADLSKELFVIGGSIVYTHFLSQNIVDRVYLSKIKGSFEGDAFFNLDVLDKSWKIVKEEENQNYNFYIMEK